MKGALLIADSARSHPDGTFSLLRGGIDRVHVLAGQPIVHRGSVVARMSGEAADAGKHEFILRVGTQSGKPVAPEMSGAFEIPRGGGGVVAVLDFALRLPAFGTYSFVLVVDHVDLDTWRVEVLEANAPVPAMGGKQ